MNKKHYLSGMALQGVLLITAVGGWAQAQSLPQTLNLSAANCIPRSAGSFQGSGSDGFRWELDGTFDNHDGDDTEQLVCAVPFDPALRRANGTIPQVVVSVDIVDNHDSKEVRVQLFRQNGNADATAVDSDDTGESETGRRTLEVSTSLLTNTRYLWILVDVPDTDNAGRSGLVGYRVRRS